MMQEALVRRGTVGTGVTALVLLAMLGVPLADEIPDALAKKLAEFKVAGSGQVFPVAAKSLARAFPGDRFYVLRFRQFPVALVPPEPLRANNLFVVKPDESVDYIRDAKALEEFFRATLAPIRGDTEARDAAKAWLRLAQEFYQDGFLQFSIPDNALRVTQAAAGGLQVTGKAVVNPRGGNMGEIDASLTFDQHGKLAKVAQAANIKRGIRPICQATKLLDPDLIVRRMAKQDILVMGKAAKGYLEEQRAKASPDLRHAIDRIWQRILAEGR